MTQPAQGAKAEKSIDELVKELTDRELLEKQVKYLYEIKGTSRKTYLNVQFFFYLFIVSVFISILIFMGQN
jgi:hypothetical protein